MARSVLGNKTILCCFINILGMTLFYLFCNYCNSFSPRSQPKIVAHSGALGNWMAV